MNSHPPESEHEFNELLAAFSERELTSWEHDRLWKLLKESPERVEQWKEQCRIVALLEHLDESSLVEAGMQIPPANVVTLPGVEGDVKNRSGKPAMTAALVGIAALIVAALIFVFRASEAPGGSDESVALARETKVETPGSIPPVDPQEVYDRAVGSIPSTASLSRPATKVSTLALSPQGGVDFNNDIRPILADKCFHCHGPDEESRKADLRLDLEESAFADLGGYAAFAHGDVAGSEAIARINEDDPDSMMPPPEFHKSLTKKEIALLTTWVGEGAEWKAHWSFEKPLLTEADDTVSKDPWVRNAIDGFVLEKLHEKGLAPNEEADRYTLARRAALDIIGLPPTDEQLQEFLDDKSETAYENYVDRLFASVHYGEHRARFWLDAARYGDTHGMHLDNFRDMWPYRDWVINAFNQNLPFDQFVIEQLGGDLLPNPSKSQLIATGFSRNNITTAEGGAILEELRVRYKADRTETMSSVFLGLTTGCAACHDHKYDPITQKEFYELTAFFNNSEDPALDGNRRDTYPVVVVPDKDTEPKWDALYAEREQWLATIARREDEVAAEVKEWWRSVRKGRLDLRHPIPDEALSLYLPLDDVEDGNARLIVDGEASEVSIGNAVPAKNHPHGSRGVRFPETGGFKIPYEVPFSPGSQMTFSYWVRTPDNLESQTLLTQESGGEKDGPKKTGWRIVGQGRGGFSAAITDSKGALLNALMPAETPLKPRSWSHISIRYSGGQAISSITMFVNGERRFVRRSDDKKIGTAFGKHLNDVMRIGSSAPTGGISDLRIFTRWLLDEEIELLAEEFELRQLVESQVEWTVLSVSQKSLLQKYYRLNHDSATRKAVYALAASQKERDYLYARSPVSMVMEESEGPAMAHILDRGEYDQKLEEVSAGVPALLPQPKKEGGLNRLDLARWLVDGENPLTSRVTVNRLWQSVFGNGIVRTAGDFGTMGEKPTHPELLDYLALKFQTDGWDVKAILREMITSSTYRQAAKWTDEKRELDPENRYFSTGPRRRLDAEAIRDQALAVSGILDRTVGGPSVRPYQPAGVWKTVAFAGSNTREFKLDPLKKLHRRSVYTFWKRTAVHPAFAAFNAPSREECTVQRERTNTPLQALVLMNDVQHVEAARKLAEHLISSAGEETAEETARRAFLRVVGHPAEAEDVSDMLALADMAGNQYRSNPESAKALAESGELPTDELLDAVEVATWTLLINMLMNRDDVINQS